VRRCVAHLYKKIQKRRSISNKPDHKGKERYRGEKDTIYKRREKRKPEQREVK
jgi:hypothetical protein